MLQRLHPASLPSLPAAVATPAYDRSRLKPGIVHLGIGAFARAHLAVVNEAALNATRDLRWGIVGVSLRHAETRDALEPQAGLYGVAERDGTHEPRLQVVGNLLRVIVAAEGDTSAVAEQIADADTRIVSLTITEKAYADDRPQGAIATLVHGLELRAGRGLAPVTLMSLDNLPANGEHLRRRVLAQAPAPLGRWIEDGCSFPNSMVDRIVPRTTDADRAAMAAALGLHDAWPVVTEPWLDWVVQDRFAAGRPDWSQGGARFVDDAAPYERLKLRMVNGAHSALAYLGLMMGCETVDAAMAEPALRRCIDRLMRHEIARTIVALPGLDIDAYATRLLQRFANPALQHRTLQIAMDGSQKLPQRLLGTVRDRLREGRSIDALALGVAAWLHHLRGVDEAGRAFTIDDPLAAALIERNDSAEHQAAVIVDPVAADHRRAEVLCGFTPVFGDLAESRSFVDAVARSLHALRRHGVRATLEARP